jgi:UDP-galactopyranose mutase
VWDYVNQFTTWLPYQHKVVSNVEGKIVPIPINIDTVNKLLGTDIKSEDDMKRWLELQTYKYTKEARNSRDSAINRMGPELYEKLIKNYTSKQWGVNPEALEASVLQRIPVRTDYNDRYFSDTYEGVPKYGYTRLVDSMLDHKNISILLNKDYFKIKYSIPTYDRIYFTGKIDSYFNDKYGKLKYRSLKFKHEVLDQESYQSHAVVNYPEHNVEYTRIIEHKKIYNQSHKKTIITKEYSSSTGEPYYPFPDAKNRAIYDKYKKLALDSKDVVFVGRLANYKYFNMDQAIKNALDIYKQMKGSR